MPLLLLFGYYYLGVPDSTLQGGDPPFPINTLRNIGIQGAQSTHVFHLDVDLIPSNRLHDHIRVSHSQLLRRLRTTDAILVVPTLESALVYNLTSSGGNLALEKQTSRGCGELDDLDQMAGGQLRRCFRPFPCAQFSKLHAESHTGQRRPCAVLFLFHLSRMLIGA